MSLPLAFLGVVAIWSTTPLAIKWSADGAGFLFGVTARMLIGLMICLVIVRLGRVALPWHRRAWQGYVAAGSGMFAAMMCVYWGSQFIPSGLVSVLFGLTPIMTGLLAVYFLAEQAMTLPKVLGMMTGAMGLYIIFSLDMHLGDSALWGILAVLMSVFLHSGSTIWVKKVNVELSPMAITTGGLLVACPLYLLSWAVMDGHLPVEMGATALAATVYLGVFGSVIGFLLYFYVLKHVEASRAALIPLVTPMIAILLGWLFNHEPVTLQMIVGTLLILSGLAFYQWGGLVLRKAYGVLNRH